MKRITPDGNRVAELRSRAGKKQTQLASEVGISERFLREVETRDKPLPEAVLARLASSLNVSVTELVRNSPGPAPSQRGSRVPMPLSAVQSGSSLMQRAGNAYGLKWEMDVDPTIESAPLFEEILTLLKHQVDQNYMDYTERPKDDYDILHMFPQIHRIARLNEIIKKLGEVDVGVFFTEYPAAYYKHRRNGYLPGRFIHLCFAPVGIVPEPRQVSLGLYEGWLRDSPAEPLDDEIPF